MSCSEGKGPSVRNNCQQTSTKMPSRRDCLDPKIICAGMQKLEANLQAFPHGLVHKTDSLK